MTVLCPFLFQITLDPKGIVVLNGNVCIYAHTWKMGKQKTEMIILSPQFDPWTLGVTQFSSLTLTTIVTFALVLV